MRGRNNALVSSVDSLPRFVKTGPEGRRQWFTLNLTLGAPRGENRGMKPDDEPKAKPDADQPDPPDGRGEGPPDPNKLAKCIVDQTADQEDDEAS